MNEFEKLVKEMRDAQKEYFRTRDKEVLKKSKGLEKKVDDELTKISMTKTSYSEPDQTALF